MITFTYRDNSLGWQKAVVIFVCSAASISDADKLFIEAIGYDPTKRAYIGVSLKP